MQPGRSLDWRDDVVLERQRTQKARDVVTPSRVRLGPGVAMDAGYGMPRLLTAETVRALQEHHLAAREHEFARRDEAGDPAAYDDHPVRSGHARTPPRG
jgi:hypothetical protein